MSADPRVQLKLHYEAPLVAQRIHLSLRGLFANAFPADGNLQRCVSYLQSVGLDPQFDPTGSIVFPVQYLRKIQDLPSRAVLLPSVAISTLLRVALLSGTAHSTVIASLDTPTILNLSWVDATGECNEPFAVAHIASLLAVGVPLVADNSTWAAIHHASALPILRAHSRINIDGFVEITTSTPQQLEISALPGLFRIDDTRFGLPLQSIANLLTMPGILFDRPPPLPPPSLHANDQFLEFVDRFAITKGQALVTPQSPFSREFCLNVVTNLQLFPLLVVTTPSSFWLWHQHLKCASGSLPRDAVRIVTYSSLSTYSRFIDASCVLLDDLDLVSANSGVLASLQCLNGTVNSYRLSRSDTIPGDPNLLPAYFSVLRPVEFTVNIPIALRYPVPATENIVAHAAMYTTSVDSSLFPDIAPKFFSESLPCPPLLADALNVPTQHDVTQVRSMRVWVEKQFELCSVGTETVLSPKVSSALEIATPAFTAGERVALATRFSRSELVVGSLLQGACARVGNGAKFQVVRYDKIVLDADKFDLVIVLDFTASYELSSASSAYTGRVHALHLLCSIEERAVEVAAFRTNTGNQESHPARYTDFELVFLLGGMDIASLAKCYAQPFTDMA